MAIPKISEFAELVVCDGAGLMCVEKNQFKPTMVGLCRKSNCGDHETRILFCATVKICQEEDAFLKKHDCSPDSWHCEKAEDSQHQIGTEQNSQFCASKNARPMKAKTLTNMKK